ncbi:MAG: peptidylprolyl isomerase [Opitutaceae bacterium]|nr:peptidylprolyl isomerase [Cytophagales bacterium]
MQIAKDKVVLVSYELKIESGEVVDSATVEDPFAFIHGNGHTLEAFDNNLNGLNVGDTFKFELEAEDAYGLVVEENVVSIPRGAFGEMPEDEMVEGAELPMQDNQGNRFYGTVLEFDEENVLMDFNHPLAGEKLLFSGKIVDVRNATAEEISHGHVHGEGGHDH